MSEDALEKYDHVRERQLTKNEARRIETKVSDARGSTSHAGKRWPFELLQNAYDPGPRLGKQDVEIVFSRDTHTLTFEHNGAPFTLQELAALLSGGSSKELDDKSTTGRFGTGFLVTHVLSPIIELTGVLDKGKGLERFKVVLDRSGDEQGITENIDSSRKAIAQAEPVEDLESIPTATFRYDVDNDEALRLGITTFRETLPYLFATCPDLGQVRLETPNGIEIWNPKETEVLDLAVGSIYSRIVQVTIEDQSPIQLRSLRVKQEPEKESALLVYLRSEGEKWSVCIPSKDFPKIFAKFPIAHSDFLPINIILEGPFDVVEERARVKMHDENKDSLSHALMSLPTVVQLAMEEAWVHGHRLAHLGQPEPTHGNDVDDQDKDWWHNELQHVAHQLSKLPLIQTQHGFLPAIAEQDGDSFANFVVPKFSLSSSNGISLARIWPLVDKAQNLNPPVEDLAEDWLETAQGWHDLGVPVNRVSLTELSREVKTGISNIDHLKVHGNPKRWLAGFLDVLGEAASTHNVLPLLEGLLPDQNGCLQSPADLRRDGGIPEEPKDIAKELGFDVRAQLLDQRLVQIGDELSLAYFNKLIISHIQREMTEEEVVEKCIRQLNQMLPEGKRVSEPSVPTSSIRFLDYLWRTKGVDGIDQARQCPLITSENLVVRLGQQTQIMAPVLAWHSDAQPFHQVYPPQRVLSSIYSQESEGTVKIVSYLIQWGIAIADPLVKEVAASELNGERLKALAVTDSDTEGVTVRQEKFSQIALLPNEVIQRCQQSKELAKDLLGLVLRYIAPHDPKWRSYREVTGYRQREEVPIRVREALWVADLTSRAWVPVPTEDGKTSQMIASAATLKDQNLIEPKWIQNNDEAITLLSDCFGLKALELRLLATPNSEELEDELAKMVQQLGSDPALYASLRGEIAEKQRRKEEVERNRGFGLAVQDAVERYLKAHGLVVTLVDWGYDFVVTVQNSVSIEDMFYRFELGSYLLEVKATTTGEVRLTPTQAATASNEIERFALCVVDLRSLPSDRLSEPWEADDIEPLACIVTKIGKLVRDTRMLVERAQESEIAIRNESALRYAVPPSIWEAGITIQEWVAQIAPHLSRSIESN